MGTFMPKLFILFCWVLFFSLVSRTLIFGRDFRLPFSPWWSWPLVWIKHSHCYWYCYWYWYWDWCWDWYWGWYWDWQKVCIPNTRAQVLSWGQPTLSFGSWGFSPREVSEILSVFVHLMCWISGICHLILEIQQLTEDTFICSFNK